MLGKTENCEFGYILGFFGGVGCFWIFIFFYLGACKVLGKTENRQVWIDFTYHKEIFLALHFDRFCLEILKKAILASA